MAPVEEKADSSKLPIATASSVLYGLFRPDPGGDTHLDLRDGVDDELAIRHHNTLRSQLDRDAVSR